MTTETQGIFQEKSRSLYPVLLRLRFCVFVVTVATGGGRDYFFFRFLRASSWSQPARAPAMSPKRVSSHFAFLAMSFS